MKFGVEESTEVGATVYSDLKKVWHFGMVECNHSLVLIFGHDCVVKGRGYRNPPSVKFDQICSILAIFAPHVVGIQAPKIYKIGQICVFL